jgi:hypothetical protein
MASDKEKQVQIDAMPGDGYVGPSIIPEVDVLDPALEIAEAEALSSRLLQMQRRLELRRKYFAFAAAFVVTLLLIAFTWLPAYSPGTHGANYLIGYLVPSSVLLAFVLLQAALAYVRASEIAFEATSAREFLDEAAEHARDAVNRSSIPAEVGTAEAVVRSRSEDVPHEAMAGIRRAP